MGEVQAVLNLVEHITWSHTLHNAAALTRFYDVYSSIHDLFLKLQLRRCIVEPQGIKFTTTCCSHLGN